MFSITVVIFREVFEISLIVSVLLAATKGTVGRRRWISSGIAAGALGSVVLALFTEKLSQAMEGKAQEVFNASVLFIAAAMIAWTVIWMRVHGRRMTENLKRIGKAVVSNEKPLHTLAVVAGLAALRESSEMVLFTFGIVASGQSAWQVAAGCALGLFLGVLMGATLYLGLVKVSPKNLFSVTSFLLVFLAAGMVSQALSILSSVGYVPELGLAIWDTSAFLPERSIPGKFFHALLGYAEKPLGIQVLGYFFTLVFITVAGYAAQKFTNQKNKD